MLKRQRRPLTFDEVDIGLSPGVTVLGGQDADRLHHVLIRGAADPLQLTAQLLHRQRTVVSVVHVQSKELRPMKEK